MLRVSTPGMARRAGPPWRQPLGRLHGRLIMLLPLLAALACAGAAAAEPGLAVRFEVGPIRPGIATLVIALFNEASPEWTRRFKRAERADAYCRAPIDGRSHRETVDCVLPPGRYIGLAFIDSDGNGTLTHGAFGPTEPFGLTGIEQTFTLPPEIERTVIDVRQAQHFRIVLN